MSNLGYFVVGLGLLAGYLVAMAAVLFGAAGTLAVPMFWAYLVLFAVLCLTASAAVYLLSQEALRLLGDQMTARSKNEFVFPGRPHGCCRR